MPGSDPKSRSPQGESGSSEKGSGSGGHDSSSGGGPTLKKASTNHTAMETAMLLYPLLENRWLWLVKALHSFAYSAIDMKIGKELGEAAQAAFETSEEVSVLRSQLNDIEQKITSTKNKIKTYETQIKNNIEGAQAVPLLAGLTAQGTRVLMEEMDLQAELLMNYQGEKVEITKELAEKEVNAAEAAAKLAAMRT